MAATAWAAVLLPLAVVLPIHTDDNGRAGLQPRHSLVRVYGYDILLRVALPLVVSLLVLGLLRRSRSQGSRIAESAAWILSIAMLGAALVGFVTFLIGIFVLPTAALLVAACESRRTESREALTSRP